MISGQHGKPCRRQFNLPAARPQLPVLLSGLSDAKYFRAVDILQLLNLHVEHFIVRNGPHRTAWYIHIGQLNPVRSVNLLPHRLVVLPQDRLIHAPFPLAAPVKENGTKPQFQQQPDNVAAA